MRYGGSKLKKQVQSDFTFPTVIRGVFLMMVKNLRDDRGPLDKQLYLKHFFVSAI